MGSNWVLVESLGIPGGEGTLCMGVGGECGDWQGGCCKVQAREAGARPRVVAVEEELWLSSESIFKVKSTMCADKSSLA